jgi:cobalt-zinc-cadmium efflux system outer membrane protein
VRAAAQQVRASAAAVALARRQRWPDLSLSVQYTQEGSGSTAITPPTVAFGLSLPLPVFYRQRGELRRAEANLAVQQLQQEKLEAQVAAEVAGAQASFVTADRLVERRESELLGRARRARDLVRFQYEKGAATLLDTLDAQRTYYAAHQEYFQELLLYWGAVFQLEQALGREVWR